MEALPAQHGSEQPEATPEELDHIMRMGKLRNRMFVEMYGPPKPLQNAGYYLTPEEKPKRKRKPYDERRELLRRLIHTMGGFCVGATLVTLFGVTIWQGLIGIALIALYILYIRHYGWDF